LAVRRQHGIIGGSTAARSQRQHRGGSGSGVSSSLPAVWRQRQWQAARWQRIGSALAAGMVAEAAATAVLPPRATAVAMKTPVATAMAGAQPDNNQQSTKSSNSNGNSCAVAAAAQAWQCSGGSGGQLGGRGGSLAAEAAAWRKCDFGSSGRALGSAATDSSSNPKLDSSFGLLLGIKHY
jgi:hypothetical protein